MEIKIIIQDSIYEQFKKIIDEKKISIDKQIEKYVEKEIKKNENKLKIESKDINQIKKFLTIIFIMERDNIILFDLLKSNCENKKLFKYGISYLKNKNIIYLANNNDWIKKIIKRSHWRYYNYSEQLRRLDFVKNEMTVRYFGPYNNHRAIEIQADKFIQLLKKLKDQENKFTGGDLI